MNVVISSVIVIFLTFHFHYANSWNIRQIFVPKLNIEQRQSYELAQLLLTNDQKALDKLLLDTISSINEPAASRLSITNNVIGCWQVGAINGRPSWQNYAKILTVLKPKKTQNRNFQFFSSNGSFSNVSEYFGSDFFAFTEGTFSLQEDSQRIGSPSCLKLNATVNRIVLTILGTSFTVNVSGRGVVTVLYGDAVKRVVESEQGAQALQIKVPFPREYDKYPRLKIFSS